MKVEMFYLNTIEQLFLFVEQLDQLEVCLPYSILLTGIPILVVFQNLRWNSNKTSLLIIRLHGIYIVYYTTFVFIFNLLLCLGQEAHFCLIWIKGWK